ncbi:MAG TPA: DUF4143 domain-containing protein [Nitriliruptorales bacterium]
MTGIRAGEDGTPGPSHRPGQAPHAALGADPAQLLGPEIELAGFLFESQVVHDLRVYAGHAGASVRFYRDSNDLEVDAIVETTDGRWAGFQVKLGTGAADEAAASLLKLHKIVDDPTRERCGSLVVVSADSPTYARGDGILVTSAAALGP